MGFWAASKAQATAVRIGSALLDGVKRSGYDAGAAFTSPYHIAFLFRLLLYLTSAELRKPFEDKSLHDGIVVGLDRLRQIYLGKVNEVTQNAASSAFSGSPDALKGCKDVDLIVSASFGDGRSEEVIQKRIKKHPIWGNEEVREIAIANELGLNETASIAISIMFFETLPD